MNGIEQARVRGGYCSGRATTMCSALPDTGQTYSKEKGKPREKEGENPLQGRHLGEEGGKLARSLDEVE